MANKIGKHDYNNCEIQKDFGEKFPFEIHKRGGGRNENIIRSKNDNSLDDCEWGSRGNKGIKISQNLCVPKNELYLSRSSNEQIYGPKNISFPKLKTNSDENVFLYSRRSAVTYKRKRSKQDHSIEKYFCKSKNIQKRQISIENKDNSTEKHNFGPKTSNEPERLCEVPSAIKNINEPGKNQLESKFNLNFALQLSSQVSNVNSKVFKLNKTKSEYFSIKKSIHKNSTTSGRKLSNWISLDSLGQKSIGNKKRPESSTSTTNFPLVKPYGTSESSDCAKTSISSKRENFDKSPKKSDWISRGFRTGGRQGNFSSRESQTSSHSSSKICFPTNTNKDSFVKKHDKGSKDKESTTNNNRKRQTTLYDYFLKKYKNISNKENNSNCIEKLDYNINDDRHIDTFGRKENRNEGNEGIYGLLTTLGYEKKQNDSFYKVISENNARDSPRSSKELKENLSGKGENKQVEINCKGPRGHLFQGDFHSVLTYKENSNISLNFSNETKNFIQYESSKKTPSLVCIPTSVKGLQLPPLPKSESEKSKINMISRKSIAENGKVEEKHISFNMQSADKDNRKPNEKPDRNYSINSRIKSERQFTEAEYISENNFHLSPKSSKENLSGTGENKQVKINCKGPSGHLFQGDFHSVLRYKENSNTSLNFSNETKNFIQYESSKKTPSLVCNPTSVKGLQLPPLPKSESEKSKINIITRKSIAEYGKVEEKHISFNMQSADKDNCKPNEKPDRNYSINSRIKSERQFTEAEYILLEDLSSPIIADPECREYLKDLIVENNKNGKKLCEKSLCALENITDCIEIPDRDIVQVNKTDSEDNNFLQFWENISSQNQKDYSQNYAIESASPRDYPEEEKISQEGSEIFQYILSQDCLESDSLINNALKNMNSLGPKIMEKKSLIFKSNQNSNKLLEIALNIYSQHKEKSILSKSKSTSIEQSSKFSVVKKCRGYVYIYKIVRNCDVATSRKDDIITEKVGFCTEDVSTRSETDKKILFGLKEICENKSYLYVETDDGPLKSVRTRLIIIDKIKTIFERILNDFKAQKSPCLELRRQTFEDCMFVNGRLELKPQENVKMIKVNYKNCSSHFRFCLMVYILAKVLQLLDTNTKTTKRELYYQIKHLISNQERIDRAVRAVSCMLCVGPWDLNIVAHKGMVFGNLKMFMSSKEVIDCNLPGTLIPQDVDEIVEFRSSASFILVVEKESIFYKLLEEDLPNKLVRPFLMITGKGFPDLNTQLFLKKLWMVMSIPILIFTDADPHGVNIMMNYRFGSLANAHLSRHLAIPKAQWLGVFPSEVVKLNADKQALTEMEKNVTQNILRTPYMKMNRKIEKELKFMLESGYKAGIEGIMKNNTFLSEFYFPLKFHNKDLI